jgi:AbrB family looped-hinge helix DNA binding protein
MVQKKKVPSCCDGEPGRGRCQVEFLIAVDERGQMVLPKEFRDRAKIGPGDKLALISWEKDGEVCCTVLMKAAHLADRVKEVLGPLMREMTGGGPS